MISASLYLQQYDCTNTFCDFAAYRVLYSAHIITQLIRLLLNKNDVFFFFVFYILRMVITYVCLNRKNKNKKK